MFETEAKSEKKERLRKSVHERERGEEKEREKKVTEVEELLLLVILVQQLWQLRQLGQRRWRWQQRPTPLDNNLVGCFLSYLPQGSHKNKF